MKKTYHFGKLALLDKKRKACRRDSKGDTSQAPNDAGGAMEYSEKCGLGLLKRNKVPKR